MTPQRPRPPQPGAPRPAGPQRPAAPRPAPARTRGPATPAPGSPGAGSPGAGAPRTTSRPGTGARTGGSGGTTGTTGTTGRTGAGADGTAPTRAVRAATGAPVAPVRTAEQPAAPGRRSSGSGLLAPRTGAFPVRPPVVSQGSAARFAERARARRRLAWRQIVVVTGSVLAAAALAWLLLLSPALALDAEQVRVTGAGTVVAVDQVAAVVDTEAGTPLTRLDTAGLRQRILDVPGVRDVTVTRDWPHGLTVQLVSREPVAAVPEAADVAGTADGAAPDAADDGTAGAEPAGPGFALVDEEGVKVGRSDTPPEGLPVVEVPVGEARILAAALGVLEQLPPDLLAAIGQVSAGTQDTVRFTLRDGATVEWGSAHESALKVAVLQALRAAPETAASTRFDVSAPTMPVVG